MAATSLTTTPASVGPPARPISPRRRRLHNYGTSSNPRMTQSSHSLQSPPPPSSSSQRHLLVDYSKRRAQLPAKAQSERHLLGGVLPRRVRSYDHDGRTARTTPFRGGPRPTRGQEGAPPPPPNSRRAYPVKHRPAHPRHGSASNTRVTTAQQQPVSSERRPNNSMTKARSAREIVDWSKLETELEWLGHAKTEAPKNSRRHKLTHNGNPHNPAKLHSSCTELLRTSFLPLGMSTSHIISVTTKPNDVMMHDVSDMTHASSSSQAASSTTSSSSPSRTQTGATKKDTDMQDGSMEDTSLRLEHVFHPNQAIGSQRNNTSSGSQNHSGNNSNNNNSNNNNNNNNRSSSSDKETDTLIKRLAQDAVTPRGRMGGRRPRNTPLHQSMTALAAMPSLRPSERLGSSRSPTRPTAVKTSDRNRTTGSIVYHASSTALSSPTTKGMDSPNRPPLPTTTATSSSSSSEDVSLTFRRSSFVRAVRSTSPPRREQHNSTSAGSSKLGDLPTWDVEFDSSLSSISTTTTMTLTSNDNQDTTTDTVPDTPVPQRKPIPEEQTSTRPASKKSNSLLNINYDDDDESSEGEDDDLLFLPKGLTASAITEPKPSTSKKTTVPTIHSMEHDTSEYSEYTEVMSSHGSHHQPAVSEKVESTPPTQDPQDPSLVLNFALRRHQRQGSSGSDADQNNNNGGKSGTSSENEEGMGDDTIRKYQRNAAIRGSQQKERRSSIEKEQQNEAAPGQRRGGKTKDVQIADRRRGSGLRRQLSVERIGCEYNRLQVKSQEDSDSKLMLLDDTTDANAGGEGERRRTGDSPDPVAGDARQRLAPTRIRSTSPRKRSATPVRKDRKPISRAKSFDEVTPSGAASSGRRGFRQSLLQKTSFMTGSRIRRHVSGGKKVSTNLHNSLTYIGAFDFEKDGSDEFGKSANARLNSSAGSFLTFE